MPRAGLRANPQYGVLHDSLKDSKMHVIAMRDETLHNAGIAAAEGSAWFQRRGK